MGALLEDRVAAWVSDHPGQTCRQIAAELGVRVGSVRQILESPLFTADRADQRGLSRWRLRTATDASGTVRAPSQCDLILQVLRDGNWHTTAEIHQRAGFSRLNSRITDLRHRGLTIMSGRVEGEPNGPRAHRYRLVTSAEPSAATASADGSTDASGLVPSPQDTGSTGTRRPPAGSEASDLPEQLALEVAA